MFRIFIINILLLSTVALADVQRLTRKMDFLPLPGGQVSLKNSIDRLFSHQKHRDALVSSKIRCVDCHSFSIKSVGKGPLSPQVREKHLRARPQVCHQCHLGKVAMPISNQCNLCHNRLENLRPKDHRGHWIKGHGMKATHNADSCLQCHNKSGCSECHFKRDNMQAKVHRGNFRFTHSMQAGANPASCVQCHQSPRFCIDCHKGTRK